MPLKNMSVQTGATMAPTGGVALVFADNGVTIPNGVQLAVPATANYALRQGSTFRYKPPTVLADGTYSRDKKSASYNVPILLASGKYSNCVIRIEREVHPEMTAAAALDLNIIAAQLLTDADATAFWSSGSTS